MVMRPTSTDELLRFIDENYHDVMAGAKFSFEPQDVPAQNDEILENLYDKPALQRAVQLHLQNGAVFNDRTQRMIKYMGDITRTEQINSIIIGSAMEAQNFIGDRKKADEYLTPGRDGL